MHEGHIYCTAQCSQMTYLMIRTFLDNVESCILKQTLCRKFSMCSVPVKIALFKAYCTSLYTAHLWSRYKQESMRKLKVAYNDSMRLLLRAPRCSSASHMFVSVGVPTCLEVLRNLMHTFMCRTTESENDIITVLTNPAYSAYRFSSRLWKHWRTSPYVRH